MKSFCCETRLTNTRARDRRIDQLERELSRYRAIQKFLIKNPKKSGNHAAQLSYVTNIINHYNKETPSLQGIKPHPVEDVGLHSEPTEGSPSSSDYADSELNDRGTYQSMLHNFLTSEEESMRRAAEEPIEQIRARIPSLYESLGRQPNIADRIPEERVQALEARNRNIGIR